MAKYRLTRNQAFPDHNGTAGDVIEVENPDDEAWKELIDARVLRPVKDKPAEQPAPAGRRGQAPAESETPPSE